ncbi:conserved hypothetical protein [Neospora caninum Liverpool]|uniref:Uncharacterized protein n=1 Tax=Neospora caninum (strain Liverpool) TaxID=572307 RepID=F0VQJ5_NEOCL|nr:conserved hypothetical protein [Neospora caninum Liverpool]CBZ55992.1 conserved hypothetical protein [Neospora caninum Liverpool]|eukprot:XP_003886018.1 conserved hypothetical protein [Neospora caninum Liverpool]
MNSEPETPKKLSNGAPGKPSRKGGRSTGRLRDRRRPEAHRAKQPMTKAQTEETASARTAGREGDSVAAKEDRRTELESSKVTESKEVEREAEGGREREGGARINSQTSSRATRQGKQREEGTKRGARSRQTNGGSTVSLGLYFAAAGLTPEKPSGKKSRNPRRRGLHDNPSISVSRAPRSLSPSAFPTLRPVDEADASREDSAVCLHAPSGTETERRVRGGDVDRHEGNASEQPADAARDNGAAGRGAEEAAGETGGASSRGKGTGAGGREAGGVGAREGRHRLARKRAWNADAPRGGGGPRPAQTRLGSGFSGNQSGGSQELEKGWNGNSRTRAQGRRPSRGCPECPYTQETREEAFRRDLRLIRHQFYSAARREQAKACSVSHASEAEGASTFREEKEQGTRLAPALDPRRLKYRGRRIQGAERRSEVKAKMLVERQLRQELFGDPGSRTPVVDRDAALRRETENDDGKVEGGEAEGEAGTEGNELRERERTNEAARRGVPGAAEAAMQAKPRGEEAETEDGDEGERLQGNAAGSEGRRGSRASKSDAEKDCEAGAERQPERGETASPPEATARTERDSGGKREDGENRGPRGRNEDAERLREQLRLSEDVRRYELCKQLTSLKKRASARLLSSVSPACWPLPASSSPPSPDGYHSPALGSAFGTREECDNRKAPAAAQGPETRSHPPAAGPRFVAHYVDMVTGEDDWESALSEFLVSLHRLQVRLLTKAPQKQATQRRFVLGLKAALVALRAKKGTARDEDPDEDPAERKKPKLIILAANCEPTVSAGKREPANDLFEKPESENNVTSECLC